MITIRLEPCCKDCNFPGIYVDGEIYRFVRTY